MPKCEPQQDQFLWPAGGSPWPATGEEVGDLEHVHAVAPGATLRVVLIPSSVLQSAANGTADMLAALRLAVSETDVASISWSLGEHYFTGWDPVTGWGTPNAQILIPLLARFTNHSTT